MRARAPARGSTRRRTEARHFHIYDSQCMSSTDTDVCFVQDGISKRFRIKKDRKRFSLLVYEDSVPMGEDDLVLQVVEDSSGNYLWSPLHGKIGKIVLYCDATNTNNGFVDIDHVEGPTGHWLSYFGHWGGFPNPILEELFKWLEVVKDFYIMNNVVEVVWNTPPCTRTRPGMREEAVSPQASRCRTGEDEAFRTLEEDVSPEASRYHTDEAFHTLRKSMVGKRFTKYFPGHGSFDGTVVQYGIATDNYIVEYDDGDDETITYHKLSGLIHR